MNPRLQNLSAPSLCTAYSLQSRLLAGVLAVATMSVGLPAVAARAPEGSADSKNSAPSEGSDVEFPSDDQGPLATAWEEVRAGDSASDAAKHGEAVEHYEKALQLLGNAPEWATQVNELRRVIGKSYYERYHVVGDPVDLHKAKSFLQAHVIELPPDMDESRKAAQHTIGEIEAELARIKQEQNGGDGGDSNEIELANPPDNYKFDAIGPTRSERIRHGFGIGTAVGGFASLGATVGFAFMFNRQNSEALKMWEDGKKDQSKKAFGVRNYYGTMAVVTGSIGAALLVTSTILFVTVSRGRNTQSRGRMARVKNRWIPRFRPAVASTPGAPGGI